MPLEGEGGGVNQAQFDPDFHKIADWRGGVPYCCTGAPMVGAGAGLVPGGAVGC